MFKQICCRHIYNSALLRSRSLNVNGNAAVRCVPTRFNDCKIGALAHCCCSKGTLSAKPTSRFPNIHPLKACRYASAPPRNSQDKQTCLEALKHNKHFTQTQHSSHPAYCTHLVEKHVTLCMYFVHNCVVNNCCRIQLHKRLQQMYVKTRGTASNRLIP